MDTEQLSNHRKHPSHILDIGKAHSIWRDPSEWNCNSCRLQRSELIKSISLWPFYSQKGDWHPSGMASICCVPFCCFGFPRALSSYPCHTHTPLPVPAIRKIRKHWKIYLPLIPLRVSSSFWGTFNLGKISFRTRLQKPEKCFLLFLFGQEDRGEILLTNETEKLCFCPRW